MNNEKKLSLLENLFELDEGTLKAETRLTDLSEWDSMTKLSLIVFMDEEFNKQLTSNDVKRLVTIQDIMNYMES